MEQLQSSRAFGDSSASTLDVLGRVELRSHFSVFDPVGTQNFGGSHVDYNL